MDAASSPDAVLASEKLPGRVSSWEMVWRGDTPVSPDGPEKLIEGCRTIVGLTIYPLQRPGPSTACSLVIARGPTPR